MNMSHYALVNRSLQSNQSTPAHFKQNESQRPYSYIRASMPDNGGMLKKAIRFDYEFSTPRIEPISQVQPEGSVASFVAMEEPKSNRMVRQDRNSHVSSPMRVQSKKESSLFSANVFSCMDSPDYQRDFEISPKIMPKS